MSGRADRLAALESERRRIFEDALHEADTVFAQYQLSQLLALGGELPEMARSVITELVRDSDAVAGALWLAGPGERSLELVASELQAPAGGEEAPRVARGSRREPVPTRFAGPGAAGEWARRDGWHGVALDERRDLGEGALQDRMVGFLALRPAQGADLPPERIRLLALVRHELAIAFRAAQLREALAGEQALLAAILDGANDAIVAVDARRQVVRANPAAVQLLGGLPARQRTLTCRELLGCGPRRGDDGAHAERLRCGPSCRFEQVMAGPTRVVECEQIVLARDGGEVPVAASYSRMPGAAPGAVVVLRDLRGERAVEELRASFLAAVSHELRTPLSLIAGYVDSLLALELDAGAQRRSVERIGHAAARLAELVDELLDLTHFAGVALQRSRVHLSTVVGRLAGDFGESPGMRPVHVALPADLPALEIDPVRIGHVLSNLVDNAQKYGGDGAIQVTARLDGESVIVTVRDRGSGIAPDERLRVFDRFYRGRDVRPGTPGSGLGLYVCRRLVEAHGGQIWVEAETTGSAISFSLPVVEDGTDAADAAEAAATRAPAPAGGRPR